MASLYGHVLHNVLHNACTYIQASQTWKECGSRPTKPPNLLNASSEKVHCAKSSQSGVLLSKKPMVAFTVVGIASYMGSGGNWFLDLCLDIALLKAKYIVPSGAVCYYQIF